VADESSNTATTTATDTTTSSNTNPIPPYYQLLRLPNETNAEFLLMRPFVPKSEGSKRQQLTAFMVARMDPGHYGELAVYEMPSAELPLGPRMVRAAMRADKNVSSEQTLLGTRTGGSEVIYGNLLLVPVDRGLLYVQPLYVQSEGEGSIPRLEKVILMLDDKIVIDNTLKDALTKMFGKDVTTQEAEKPSTPSTPTTPSTPVSGTKAQQAATLLNQAADLFDQADKALEAKDLATYQKDVKAAQAKVQQALKNLSG